MRANKRIIQDRVARLETAGIKSGKKMPVEEDASLLVAEQEMTRAACAKKDTPCVACLNGGDGIGVARGQGRHGRSVAKREDT